LIVLPSFAIQHIVLHECTMKTILVRKSEERLFGRLRCKVENKNKMVCTAVGKEDTVWVHMDKVRDSKPSRSQKVRGLLNV